MVVVGGWFEDSFTEYRMLRGLKRVSGEAL